ncbi:MAG: phage tail sheath family protein [Synergistaceae bacterium]|nr:phage tail sheath family protein [Synergistaceae bacterium]
MAFRHGVYKQEVPTSLTAPVQTDTGLPVIIGTAPLHLAEGGLSNVNKPQLIYNYNEAVSLFGYSDDWDNYTLCEFIYSQFALFAMSPCVLINVLDPSRHKEAVSSREYEIAGGEVNLGANVVINDESFVVATLNDESERVIHTLGRDYSVAYDASGNAILTVIEGGALEGKSSVLMSFTKIKPNAVTASDIIGGVDATTGVYTGLELVGSVFPRFRLVPGLIGAPKWSCIPEVAAVMRAKAENINGLFTAQAVVDIPCDSAGADVYTEAPEWKNRNNYTAEREIVCWPKVKLGDKTYHLSTQLIGLMNQVDSGNEDIPYESPSNKALQMDSCVVASGREADLGLEQANYLNGQGIVTALNWTGGWRAWGNRTGAYPASTDAKDMMIPVRRMFDWIGNRFILKFWEKVDDPANTRLIRTVINSFNVEMNGLAAMGAILGGRIEFLSTENTSADLLDGKLRFHIYITPPSPAEEITGIFEFDPEYLDVLFSAVR